MITYREEEEFLEDWCPESSLPHIQTICLPLRVKYAQSSSKLPACFEGKGT